MTPPDPPSFGASPMRLLFVCSGNTCRSPLAEALARSLVQGAGLGPLEVRSAGTSAMPGSPASEGARRAARRHGLSLEGHSSSRVSPQLLAWADKVLVMGPAHLQVVRALGGGGKAAVLGAFARGLREEDPGEDLSVPDPFGGDDGIYEETFGILEHYVTLAITRMAGEGG